MWGEQGSKIAAAVASGKAELGLTFISEMLPNKGVRIAGSLPNPIQSPAPYVVAILAASAQQIEVRAFLTAVRSPLVWPVIARAGSTPARK